MTKNVYPIFERMLGRSDKEMFLKQKSLVIWIVGLSGSGKSTIAIALEKKLHELGFLTQILDGDNIRAGINKNLTFTREDRNENIRRISEVSKLFVNCGVITLNSFITPRREMRGLVKSIIGDENFFEIYVDTPLEVCERRDVKGLYKKARAGEIKNFTGIDAPFEQPMHADVTVQTVNKKPEDMVKEILEVLLPRIKY